MGAKLKVHIPLDIRMLTDFIATFLQHVHQDGIFFEVVRRDLSWALWQETKEASVGASELFFNMKPIRASSIKARGLPLGGAAEEAPPGGVDEAQPGGVDARDEGGIEADIGRVLEEAGFTGAIDEALEQAAAEESRDGGDKTKYA